MIRARNPEQLARSIWAEALEPPPQLDLNRWAEENVVFGAESSFPGPYRREKFPYFAAILEALSPFHPATTVVLKKSAQLGGTVLAQIFLAGTMDQDPCGFLYTHPTQDNAKRWVNTKWRPMIKGTKALGRVFGSSQKSRDNANSVFYQEPTHGAGWLQISGAASESSLSLISPRKQVQDDLAKWEFNAAGDPERQADTRSKSFDERKIFKISTPLISDNCRITAKYKLSDQREYQVPCPHCGHRHALKWENFHVDEEAPANSFFNCPDCGGIIEQIHRSDMLAAGIWVAQNPNGLFPGFYLWSAYSPLESWGDIAERWLSAKGDPLAEQVFYNDDLGLAFEMTGVSPPWKDLYERAMSSSYARGIVPPGALLLTVGVDVQEDRLEWHLVGWGRDLHRFVIDYGVIFEQIGSAEAHRALTRLLGRTWPDEIGRLREIDKLAIDGNWSTDDVFDWVRSRPASKVAMVRGVSGDNTDVLSVVKEKDKTGKIKRRHRARWFNVGVNRMKSPLYRSLRLQDPEQRGYCHFCRDLPEDYFQQLTSHHRKAKKTREGVLKHFWELKSGLRDEVLDTMLYAEAMAFSLGWRTRTEEQWDEREAEILALPVPQARQLDLEDLLHNPAPKAVASAKKPDNNAALPDSKPTPDQSGMDQKDMAPPPLTRRERMRNIVSRMAR